MFDVKEIKPCADNEGDIQAQCTFELVSLQSFKSTLEELNFKTLIIGTPEVLIGRRDDAMLLISHGSLIASRVKSKQHLTDLLNTITLRLKYLTK
jgi:hypothetical protein